MSHGTSTFLRSPLRWIAVCTLCAVVGAGAYVATAAASDGASPSPTGHAVRQGFSVVRGGDRVDATVLSDGPPVSDGELLIHAAYEAARRMVEMQTTGTTTEAAAPVNANP